MEQPEPRTASKFDLLRAPFRLRWPKVRRKSVADLFRSSKLHHPYRDSFHRAVYPVILVAQVFALMPVEGISAPNATFLKFNGRSLRAIYAFGFALVATAILLFEIHRVMTSNNTTAKNLGVVFFGVTATGQYLFIYIAKHWRQLMMRWAENESVFLKYPYFKEGRQLRRKICTMGAVVWTLALIEHSLSRASNFYGHEFEIRVCNYTVLDHFDFFVQRDFAHLFRFFPYHKALGMLFFAFNLWLTFTWNFLDLLIICISFGIAERLQQLNEHLIDIYKNKMSEMESIEFWKRTRWHYGLICEIVEAFNTSISFVIILSCLSNLYFICLQVLNVTIPLPHTINFVYFWFSLVYLILRTVAVFLSSAEVNEQAIKPLEIIRHLPNAYWNIEVERLANQIRCEIVALSGMKFFNMTRRLLFGMLGTIITYEIVLMQFDTSDKQQKQIKCDPAL